MVAHIEEHFNQKGHKFKLLSIINTHTHTHVIAWDAIKSHSAYDSIKHQFYNTNKNFIYLTVYIIKLNKFLTILLVYFCKFNLYVSYNTVYFHEKDNSAFIVRGSSGCLLQ